MVNDSHQKPQQKISVGDIFIIPKRKPNIFYLILVEGILDCDKIMTRDLNVNNVGSNQIAIDGANWLLNRHSLHLKLSDADE